MGGWEEEEEEEEEEGERGQQRRATGDVDLIGVAPGSVAVGGGGGGREVGRRRAELRCDIDAQLCA